MGQLYASTLVSGDASKSGWVNGCPRLLMAAGLEATMNLFRLRPVSCFSDVTDVRYSLVAFLESLFWLFFILSFSVESKHPTPYTRYTFAASRRSTKHSA